MIVVKVGGSLYDHPRLGEGLRAFATADMLFVPGGGPFADAVRTMDAVHALGEEASHRVALASLIAAGAFLKSLVPTANVVDARAFCDRFPGLPASWGVTTDSIAAHVAVAVGGELVLLKSCELLPGMTWSAAAAAGMVDAYFPTAAAGVAVRVVNFRAMLDRQKF